MDKFIQNHYSFVIGVILAMSLGPSVATAQTSLIKNVQKRFTDVPLYEVLDWAEQQYEIKIAYSKSVLGQIMVNKVLEVSSAEDLLENVLKNTGLGFRVINESRILVGPDQMTTDENKESQYYFSGQIVDSESGDPLSYATVIDPETLQGTTSDENGNFKIKVNTVQAPPIFRISYVGYRDQTIHASETDEVVKIKMKLKTIEFEGVTIFESVPALAVNKKLEAMSLHVDDLKGLSALSGGLDILRTVQMLPGIAAHDDLSASLKVRGSSPDENMVMLDGMLMYNVDHFYGIFSAIHPDIVDKINVYKNAFPIEYTGRTASVIEMQTAEGHPESFKMNIGADLIAANAYLEMPIGSNMSLMAAGRITHQDVANGKIFDLLASNEASSNIPNDGNLDRSTLLRLRPDFKFFDTFAKWKWDINQKNHLALSFYRGEDQYNYAYSESYPNFFNSRLFQNIEESSEVKDWTNQAIGLKYSRNWNDKLTTEIHLGRSFYQISTDENFSFTQNFTRRDIAIEKTLFANVLDSYNEVKGYRFDAKNSLKVGSHDKLTFGYTYVRDDVGFEVQNQRTSVDKNEVTQFGRAGNTQQNTVYGQYELSPEKDWSLSLGLSATHYDSTDRVYFSPRLKTTYSFDEKFYLKGSYSYYQQFLRQFNHESIFGRNQTFWLVAGDNGIPVSTSAHYMLGANYLSKHFEVDIELYKKKLGGVTDYATLNPGFKVDMTDLPSDADFKLFNGSGDAYGLDLLFKGQTKNYTGWLAYSLSKATSTFRELNRGNPIPSQDDRRHQLKIVNIYRLKNWTFSANYIFASGSPYLDLSRLTRQSNRNRQRISFNDAQSRLPSYHRFDLGVNYQWKVLGKDATVGLSIFNLLNRQNVKIRQYVFAVQEQSNNSNVIRNTIIGNELELLDRTLNLNLSISF